MKKLYINFFFQIISIILIIRIIYYDNTDFNKLSFLYSANIIILLLLIISAQLLITFLFNLLLSLISSKKSNFFLTSSFFLQGGIVNQLFPGLGFIFKYYKFRSESNISISEYATAQSFWSLFIFTAYLLLAVILGFTQLLYYPISFLTMSVFIALFAISFFILRKPILNKVKIYLMRFKKIQNFLNELKIIKDKLFNNLAYLLAVFVGFIFLGILQCFNFYVGLIFFGAELSFMSSNYIYISSSLTSFLTLINFFGLFELILHVSTSIFVPSFKDIIIFALAYRLISIFSSFIIIILFSILRLIKKF